MIDLTPVINVFIAVVVAFLMAYVIPWIKSKTAEKELNPAPFPTKRWINSSGTNPELLPLHPERHILLHQFFGELTPP